MAEYEWKQNPACVATYNILEGDKFLDQFEDIEIPFEKAGDLKISDLLFFPGTTTNTNILKLISLNMAQKFLSLIVKTYTVKKENPNRSTPDTIRDIARIFEDGTRTLTDLAKIVDDAIKFPSE